MTWREERCRSQNGMGDACTRNISPVLNERMDRREIDRSTEREIGAHRDLEESKHIPTDQQKERRKTSMKISSEHGDNILTRHMKAGREKPFLFFALQTVFSLCLSLSSPEHPHFIIREQLSEAFT